MPGAKPGAAVGKVAYCLRRSPDLSEAVMSKLIAKHLGRAFVIELELGIGAYLIVYEGLNLEGRSVADHLLDSVEMAKDDALELYGVPIESWAKMQSSSSGS
jgi:hypothetical protein